MGYLLASASKTIVCTELILLDCLRYGQDRDLLYRVASSWNHRGSPVISFAPPWFHPSPLMVLCVAGRVIKFALYAVVYASVDHPNE